MNNFTLAVLAAWIAGACLHHIPDTIVMSAAILTLRNPDNAFAIAQLLNAKGARLGPLPPAELGDALADFLSREAMP